ncbi:MAG: GspE/PulE/PilB domain-containing protein [Planctomycetota bacterium]|jgi:type IV pilus assembly protein PilB
MVRITRMTRKRLGELLRDEGLVTDEQIEEALASQRKTGELLGEVLVRLGYVTEYDIAKTIVTQFGLPYISVKQYFRSDEVMTLFPERLMRQYQFIPLDKIGNVIAIAVGGLLNFDVLSELEHTSGAYIQVYVATWSEIKTEIEEHFKSAKPAKGEEPAKEEGEAGEEPADAAATAATATAAAAAAGGVSLEDTDAALAEMELVTPGPAAAAPAAPAAAQPAAQAAPAAEGEGESGDDDLTELGNLLLGDIGDGGGSE